MVDDDDDVMLINSDGIIIRISASDVSILGRATQGVKIMRVEEGTKIVAMAKVIKEDEEDDSDAPAAGAAKGGKAAGKAKAKANDGEQETLDLG